jgi:hypothetical protein
MIAEEIDPSLHTLRANFACDKLVAQAKSGVRACLFVRGTDGRSLFVIEKRKIDRARKVASDEFDRGAHIEKFFTSSQALQVFQRQLIHARITNLGSA